jgi:putative NADH-flavin reductase
MKIVVFGPTGGTGQAFVRQALAGGHRVAAIALPGTDVGTLHERLEIVRGNILEPQTWAHALKGAGGVFSALGAHGWGPTSLCHDGTMNMINEMKKANVKRLVIITTAALTSKPGFIFGKIVTPLFLKNIYGDKEKQEGVIRDSGLDWVMVRPMRLYDGPKTDQYQIALGDQAAAGWRVSREDVAAFSLGQVIYGDYVHQAPVLAEPLSMMWTTYTEDYAARSQPAPAVKKSATALRRTA